MHASRRFYHLIKAEVLLTVQKENIFKLTADILYKLFTLNI